MTERYNGSFMHWTGALLHIADKTRWDMAYVAMRMAGYNNCPSIPCYRILYQAICYLFHHPLVPIMYPNKSINEIVPLKSHFSKGEAEVTSKDYDAHTGLEAWADADLARDILGRRSTSSSVHTWGDVAVASQCVKQPEPGASTNDAEVRSLYQATRRTLAYRSILASLGQPQQYPTPTFEDNAATIAQVLNDKLTPRVKHIDLLLKWLNNQFSRERMTPITCSSKDQKGDMNSKPHGGSTLQKKFLPLVGYQYYPPPSSEHYTLLQLDKFIIGTHRGSFLKLSHEKE